MVCGGGRKREETRGEAAAAAGVELEKGEERRSEERGVGG